MKEKLGFQYTNGDFEEQNRLLKLYNGDDLFREAAFGGHLSLVEFIMSKSANTAYAAAELASRKGGDNIHIIKFLIEEYEFQNFKDIMENACNCRCRGLEPRNVEVVKNTCNCLELVKYLVGIGANRNVGVSCAVDSNAYHIVKYLIENGANVSASDLLLASVRGYSDIVRYLIEGGANIHSGNNHALQYAVRYGDFDLVKFLVEHGANIHSRDDEAIRYAKHKRFQEIIDYLSQFY